MSKSNATEIISVLYLIAAILAQGFHQPKWLVWLLVFLTFENIVESIYNSFKEHKS